MKKLKKKKKIQDKDFHYCVEVDYDYHYNCGEEGCDNEGICRCGTLENIRVIHCDIEPIVKKFSAYTDLKNPIKKYCLERFLTRLVKKNISDLFDVNVCSSYYGEEIRNISLNTFAANDIENFLKILNKNKYSDAIEFLLMREYGYVLPAIKGKAWHAKKVSLDDIENTINNKLDFETVREYEAWESRQSCLCQRIGKKYKLIDGRHRFQGALCANKKKILAIWCP